MNASRPPAEAPTATTRTATAAAAGWTVLNSLSSWIFWSGGGFTLVIGPLFHGRRRLEGWKVWKPAVAANQGLSYRARRRYLPIQARATVYGRMRSI